MPIYDQTFRRYEGPRRVRALWLPVAWQTLRRVLRTRLTYLAIAGAAINDIRNSI